MTEKVHVVIPASEMEMWVSEWWGKFSILHKLKKAGAPVKGAFSPELKVGTVTAWQDKITLNYHFVWEDKEIKQLG